MTSLKDLLAQKSELERQIAELQKTSRADAIAEIKRLMSETGLTIADLGKREVTLSSSAVKGTKVAAKYRDPESGATWSGRGLKPRWLAAALDAGKKIEDFSV